MSETLTATEVKPKNKGGRPKGAKDSAPRPRRKPYNPESDPDLQAIARAEAEAERPLTASDVERIAIQAVQAAKAQGVRGERLSTIIKPGGKPESGDPFLDVKHPGLVVGKILSDPEVIIKTEYRKPGFKYAWPKFQNDNQTRAFISAGVYTPVPVEAIARVPEAAISRITMPDGTEFVGLGPLILVEISPEHYEQNYTVFEKYGWKQQAQLSMSMESRLNQSLSGSGMRAEVKKEDRYAEGVRIKT